MKNNYKNNNELDLSEIINRQRQAPDMSEADKKVVPIRKNILSEVLEKLNEHN